MTETKEFLDEVLGLVNAARVALHYQPLEELPRGRKGGCTMCPLARALSEGGTEVSVGGVSVAFRGNAAENATQLVGAAWGTKVLYHVEDAGRVRLPHTLKTFVTGFDCGNFPDLILGGRTNEPE